MNLYNLIMKKENQIKSSSTPIILQVIISDIPLNLDVNLRPINIIQLSFFTGCAVGWFNIGIDNVGGVFQVTLLRNLVSKKL